MPATKSQIKSQALRVKALEIELTTCDTRAKHVCVYRALDEATRKLREMLAA
jgi:predicted metal-binding protein